MRAGSSGFSFALAGAGGRKGYSGIEGVAKAALDITRGAIGTFGGGMGFAVSFTYFLSDATIGWGSVLKNFEQFDKAHWRITGKGILQGSRF